jgi:RNA polymerase sigma-70 factor (ECF subfamily)
MSRDASASAPMEELLRRAREGDRAAFEELFRRYRPRLEAWASQSAPRAGPGIPRPSDIVQETSLRAFSSFSAFNGSTEGEWITWLHRIFERRKTQFFRDAQRKKRKDTGALPLDSPEAEAAPALQKSPSQALAHDEQWRQILTELFRLPDDQSKAIYLCYLKELPVAEVARRLDRTEAAVAGLLQRGLKALRGRIENEVAAEILAEPAAKDALGDATAALLIYLRRREAGEAVEVDAFVAEHPACADELRPMLRWIERIRALAPGSAGRTKGEE